MTTHNHLPCREILAHLQLPARESCRHHQPGWAVCCPYVHAGSKEQAGGMPSPEKTMLAAKLIIDKQKAGEPLQGSPA
jgi:hypothetical protein